MASCPKCAHRLQPDASFCNHCGAAASVCPHCEKVTPGVPIYCACGYDFVCKIAPPLKPAQTEIPVAGGVLRITSYSGNEEDERAEAKGFLTATADRNVLTLRWDGPPFGDSESLPQPAVAPERPVFPGTVDEANGIWTATPHHFPNQPGIGRTREAAEKCAWECIDAEVRAIGSRLAGAVDAMIGRADEIGVKFSLYERCLPDIETVAEVSPDDSYIYFEIVPFLGDCYVGRLDVSGVERVANIFRRNGGDPTSLVSDLEAAVRLMEEVSRRPGITQFAARELLAIDKEVARRVLKYMEAFGTIRRTPTAKTNRLYPGIK